MRSKISIRFQFLAIISPKPVPTRYHNLPSPCLTVSPLLRRTWRGVWISMILIILLCSLAGFGYIYHTTELEMSESLRTDAEWIVVDLNNQLSKAKNQIMKIKDKNDFLKRDIEMYIETTHPKVPEIVVKEISKQVVELSRKYKISPELIIGIIKVESSFNPMAVGSKTKHGNARGLMQVMPEWVKKLGLKSQYDFHNIDIGIESGIRVFLIHLEEGKGDISTGLYYYVNKDKSYVDKVYASMGKFSAFRSTIDEDDQNVETDINLNGDLKDLPEGDVSDK